MLASERSPAIAAQTFASPRLATTLNRLHRSPRAHQRIESSNRPTAESSRTSGNNNTHYDSIRTPSSYHYNSDGSLETLREPSTRSFFIGSPGRSSSAVPNQSANMDHRAKASKVTLPPLSSLTSSIESGPRHDHQLEARRTSFGTGSAYSSRDATSHDVRLPSLDHATRDPYHSQDRRYSVDRSSTRSSRPVSAAYSPSDHTANTWGSRPGSPSSRYAAPSASSSVLPPRTTMRGVIESTRPRSYSSPHRHRMPNPARRSSVADASEVDRLLEGLIYVQDINRRLGLNTGGPASPAIFQNPDAAEVLRQKLQEELNTMALFSQSRAESVANHLGLPTYLPPPRRYPETARARQSENPSSMTSSGQAGHPSWTLGEAAERPPSSMGRLTLEERNSRDYEYAAHAEAMDLEYEEARRAGHGSRYHPSSGHPHYTETSLRTISRATSFDHPRTGPYQQDRHPYFDHAPSDDPRSGHDHQMRHTLGSSSLPPALYHPESRHHQQMELLDHRRLAGKGMKRVKKRKNEHHQECLGCQAKETPEWRKGPMGPRTLCNACGLLYAKLTKRKQQEAEAAAKASGKTAEEIVREREESPGAKQASLEALRTELNLANGTRNRSGSTSTPVSGHVDGMPSARYYDNTWPAQHHPFAHQPPQQQQSSSMSGPSGPALDDRMDSRTMEGLARPYSGGGGVPRRHHPYL